jgi:antirestriction protein ArdC
MATKTKRPAPDVYAMVTDQMLKALENEIIPWRKPWSGEDAAPMNATSGKQYRGANPLLLNCTAVCKGFDDPRWLSFKQAKAAGGNVRKGEKGSIITFWKFLKYNKVIDGETQKAGFPMLKYFSVFNVEQCENINEAKIKARPEAYTPTAWEKIENAEQLTAGYLERESIKLSHVGASAHYNYFDDQVNMPATDRFDAAEDYYSTLFHELGHSTGHKKRLNREIQNKFGSAGYAREELVAEFTAAFLCGTTGIESKPIEDHAAYIASWKQKLEADPKAVIFAAGRAQKAADMITDRQVAEAETETETVTA